jgi:beta-glucosidase
VTRAPLADFRDTGMTAGDRVEALVAAMSRDEKIALARSDFAALSHLGLPALVYADGPCGVRGAEGVTALPVSLALAATFDRDLARDYGRVVGAEVRAAGCNVLLGPTVDVVRTPLGGRQPEGFGEDPALSGAIGAAYVRGVAEHQVVAMVKHFIGNNFETGRTGRGWPPPRRGPAVDVEVSEQALREIYYPPVRAALVDGGALALMGSYNRLRGEYVCQNGPLLDVPKLQWGWPGCIAPDFKFAVRDPLSAARAGLDIPGLDGAAGREVEHFGPDGITDPRLDEIVRRIATAMIGGGLLDRPVEVQPGPPSTEEHIDLALRVATAGMVLLKNDGCLPLGTGVRSIAVIGPAGLDAIYVMGGSAGVALPADGPVTPLAGITERAGDDVVVRPAQGSRGDVGLPPVPADLLRVPGTDEPGVQVEFADADTPDTQLRTVQADLDQLSAPAGFGPNWTARVRTHLRVPAAGRYRFSLLVSGIARVTIDGAEVMSGEREARRFIVGPEYPLQCLVRLAADSLIEIGIDYQTGGALQIPELGLCPGLQLGWQPPDALIEEAAAAAAASDVAVVLVQQASGEGMDRVSLELPGDQDALVEAVAAANQRTVVVLNTPGASLLPWADRVAAVLASWYPGQVFGRALAAVLFGDEPPRGRLPVTFPADAAQGPGHDPAEYPGTDGVARYREGIDVGYRYWQRHRQRPRFAFGHGLSYTSFRLLDGSLSVQAGHSVIVTARVRNAGDRPGTAVVQAYVENPPQAQSPPRQLRAWGQVTLAPGADGEIRLSLAPKDFAVFDEPAARWLVHQGVHRVHLGFASDALPVTLDLPLDHRDDQDALARA